MAPFDIINVLIVSALFCLAQPLPITSYRYQKQSNKSVPGLSHHNKPRGSKPPKHLDVKFHASVDYHIVRREEANIDKKEASKSSNRVPIRRVIRNFHTQSSLNEMLAHHSDLKPRHRDNMGPAEQATLDDTIERLDTETSKLEAETKQLQSESIRLEEVDSRLKQLLYRTSWFIRERPMPYIRYGTRAYPRGRKDRNMILKKHLMNVARRQSRLPRKTFKRLNPQLCDKIDKTVVYKIVIRVLEGVLDMLTKDTKPKSDRRTGKDQLPSTNVHLHEGHVSFGTMVHATFSRLANAISDQAKLVWRSLCSMFRKHSNIDDRGNSPSKTHDTQADRVPLIYTNKPRNVIEMAQTVKNKSDVKIGKSSLFRTAQDGLQKSIDGLILTFEKRHDPTRLRQRRTHIQKRSVRDDVIMRQDLQPEGDLGEMKGDAVYRRPPALKKIRYGKEEPHTMEYYRRRWLQLKNGKPETIHEKTIVSRKLHNKPLRSNERHDGSNINTMNPYESDGNEHKHIYQKTNVGDSEESFDYERQQALRQQHNKLHRYTLNPGQSLGQMKAKLVLLMKSVEEEDPSLDLETVTDWRRLRQIEVMSRRVLDLDSQMQKPITDPGHIDITPVETGIGKNKNGIIRRLTRMKRDAGSHLINETDTHVKNVGDDLSTILENTKSIQFAKQATESRSDSQTDVEGGDISVRSTIEPYVAEQDQRIGSPSTFGISNGEKLNDDDVLSGFVNRWPAIRTSLIVLRQKLPKSKNNTTTSSNFENSFASLLRKGDELVQSSNSNSAELNQARSRIHDRDQHTVEQRKLMDHISGKLGYLESVLDAHMAADYDTVVNGSIGIVGDKEEEGIVPENHDTTKDQEEEVVPESHGITGDQKEEGVVPEKEMNDYAVVQNDQSPNSKADQTFFDPGKHHRLHRRDASTSNEKNNLEGQRIRRRRDMSLAAIDKEISRLDKETASIVDEAEDPKTDADIDTIPAPALPDLDLTNQDIPVVAKHHIVVNHPVLPVHPLNTEDDEDPIFPVVVSHDDKVFDLETGHFRSLPDLDAEMHAIDEEVKVDKRVKGDNKEDLDVEPYMMGGLYRELLVERDRIRGMLSKLNNSKVITPAVQEEIEKRHDELRDIDKQVEAMKLEKAKEIAERKNKVAKELAKKIERKTKDKLDVLHSKIEELNNAIVTKKKIKKAEKRLQDKVDEQIRKEELRREEEEKKEYEKAVQDMKLSREHRLEERLRKLKEKEEEFDHAADIKRKQNKVEARLSNALASHMYADRDVPLIEDAVGVHEDMDDAIVKDLVRQNQVKQHVVESYIRGDET